MNGAAAVLFAHQRQDSGRCLCGWNTAGRSHTTHVLDALRRVAPGDGPHLLIRDTGEMERCW